jgi:hypothetical protein
MRSQPAPQLRIIYDRDDENAPHARIRPNIRRHRINISIIYDRVTGESAPTMRFLYIVFVLCVAALLFTALAAARHIRRHEQKRKASAEETPAPTDEVTSNSEILVPAGKTQGH